MAAAERSIIAFRADPELIERAERAAAAEGISRSDVVRRALMRDLRELAKPIAEEAA